MRNAEQIKSTVFYTLILVLPLALLLFSIDSFDRLQKERYQKEVTTTLEDLLDRITVAHDDSVFFHLWLQKLFLNTDSDGSPEKFIATIKEKLKHNCQVIVWDNKGKIIDSLSDEKGYQFVLKKMYQTISDFNKHARSSAGPSLSKISFDKNTLVMIQKYFGSMLTEELMFLPLLNGSEGRAIKVSHDPRKGYLWFQKGSNFSVSVFISANLKNKNIGLSSIVSSFNEKNRDLKLGFIELPDRKIFGPPLGSSAMGALKLQSMNYTKAVFDLQSKDRYDVLFRQITPFVQVFALHSSDQTASYANQFIFRILRVLIIICFVIYCFSMRSKTFFSSVKTRIVGLMIVAAIIPCIAFSLTGHEYLHYKITTMIDQTQIDGERIIREFDSLYPISRNKIASELNQMIADYNAKYRNERWDAVGIQSFRQKLEKYRPNQCFLVDLYFDCEFIFGSEIEKNAIDNVTSKATASLLRGLNNSLTLQFQYAGKGYGGFADDYNLFVEGLNSCGKIILSDILSKFYLVYQNYTGIPEYGGSKYFVFIAWSIESFQYNFLVQELEKINQMIKPGRLIVRLKDSSRILPEGAGNYSNLDWLLRKADTSKFSLNDSLTVGNEKFVAVAMPGLNFEAASLAYIYPRQLLEKKVDAIRRNLVASVLLFLSVLIVFAWKFAKHQVKPVELLEHGLKSIACRDFNCQLDFHSSDEFGDLIQTFNSAIENMKDLEVARSVQESLLPPSDFSTDKLEIYVKTQFMTSMGGDYFDIAAGNGKVFIAFGDVAGHGIPAALVMAMIKAVFSDCIESGDEKTFLESCNKIMLYLRNKGWKRMMTLQFIVIDESSNEFSIVNAGHCFPVKIDADKKKVSFIRALGIPLGYVLTKNYTVVNDVLNPGETLVLYSDGLIEGTCATGEMFGFDRFESLLLETVSDSSPIMWQKIVSAVTNWCVEQSDDLSTMIVRMK